MLIDYPETPVTQEVRAMAQARRQAAETDPKEAFAGKYGKVEKIWSGKSFIRFHDYKTLLAELPVSEVAVPHKEYRRRMQGNLEYVYGEMLYSLTGFEGYLRDKAFPLNECFIRPLIRVNTFILEFNIRYHTKAGEEETRSCEVLRLGSTKYLFYTDYHRPL
jgi:hypothetical protein